MPRVHVVPILALLVPSVALAASISGTVTDGTTEKPSAGDAVVLISLQGRMQEVVRTTTDQGGHYTLDLPGDAAGQGMHLVRVDHQKASYFQPAPPNVSDVNVTVYDVAPTVQGITTEANVMRMETDGNGLKVTQSYFIKNDSHPPKTQFSSHSFDIYLPPGAKIEGAAAMGPGGMPVASSPAPMGEPGHYAYLFPLRPGETQFQLSYHLPYSGSLNFTPRLGMPAENVVVMLPKAMTFKPDAGSAFQPINDDISAQTFVAKNVAVGQPVGFQVSGSGSLPRDVQGQQVRDQPANGQPGDEPPGTANQDTRPGGGLGVPIDTPDPLNKYKWWILSGIGLLFAIAAAFFLRKPAVASAGAAAAAVPGNADGDGFGPNTGGVDATAARSVGPGAAGSTAGSAAFAPASNGAVAHAASGSPLLNALRDELFALESERLQGKLSEAEYTEHKAALDTVLRRALSR